jgi:hypothetical protein
MNEQEPTSLPYTLPHVLLAEAWQHPHHLPRCPDFGQAGTAALARTRL